MYISTQADLDTLIKRLKKEKIIYFDTEFIRERTFYPELCLIQLSVVGKQEAVECFLIDPLAGLDVVPLFKALCKVVLVFHSGKQDLEIIYNYTKKLPKKIFDTQIAAMVCGFGEQVGYAELAQRLANVHINKAHQFTDWKKRPLDQNQLDYALADVLHLPRIHQALENSLKTNKRKKYVEEDEEDLLDKKNYEEDAENAWQKLKHRDKRNCDQNILRSLCAWRDLTARKVNRPRRHLLRDEAIIEIALHRVDSAEGLRKLRNQLRVSNEMLQELVAVITEAKNQKQIKEKKSKFVPKERVDPFVVDLLKVLLKKTSDEHKIAPRLIANTDDIEDFLRGEKVPFVKGWRKEIFGEPAKKLLNGEINFRVKNGSIVISEV